MAIPSNKILPKICSKYFCKNCDYTTCKKSSYNDHLLSAKHIKSINVNEILPKFCSRFVCQNCNKSYKDNSGLWRHKKKCKEEPKKDNEDSEKHDENLEEKIKETKNLSQLEVITELFQEQLKENKELKELLIEQNKKLIELAEKSQNQVTNITNNNTTNNNNFNLNFFLNEKCKDALNIMDFINQLQVKLSDLDMVGRIGYTEGISKIFIRGLKELDVFKRPIHCSDLKREVLYVKDQDSWEKDTSEKDRMKKAIKFIAAKNLKQLNEWKEEYPESDDYDSKKHMEYHNIIINATGGSTVEEDDKNFNKIIRNVSKEVAINKLEN
jgi:hypothetical protein